MTRKTSKQTRLAAFILSLVMLLTVAPISAYAQEGGDITIDAIDEIVTGEEIVGEVEPTEQANAVTLMAADVPECIPLSDLTARGTVRRLYDEEESLSTVLFENDDGTRTLYMYGVPVKYIAPDGNIRDKSTAISALTGLESLWNGTTLTVAQAATLAQNASIGRLDLDTAADTLTLMNTQLAATYGSNLTLSDMAYATLDSDIRSLYPTAVSDGIVLNYGEYSIRTIPVATGSLVLPGAAVVMESTSLTDSETRTRVRYNGAFGMGTVLQYTPTTMGMKEEVILTSNVGKNSFSFLIETGGMTIEEENGNYFFFDPETQSVVAQLGEVIAYDSNGQIVRGEMTVQTIREGLQYGVTISVSEQFLASAAYPVSVDPTITLQPDMSDAKYDIDYVSVYDTTDASGYTFDAFHTFGYIDNPTGFPYYGGAFFRFPGLYTSTCEYYGVTSDLITQMTLCLRTGTTRNESITLIANPVNCIWTSGTRIYGADYYYNSSDDTYQGSGTRDADGKISIDLTEIAKVWADWNAGTTTYSYGNPANGVLVKAHAENNYINNCTVTTSDVYAVLQYNPSLIIEVDGIKSSDCSNNTIKIEMEIGETKEVHIVSCFPKNATVRCTTSTDSRGIISLDSQKITAIQEGTGKVLLWLPEYPDVNVQCVEVTVHPSTGTNIEEDSVYMIKNISTGKYLQAGTSSVTLSTKDEMNGKQLWYVTKSGANYILYSMGVKTLVSGARGEKVLKGNAQMGADNESAITWAIQDGVSGQYLQNTDSSYADKYLSADGITGVSLQSICDESEWIFEKIPLSSFNNYYAGNYVTSSGQNLMQLDGNNGKLHIQVVVDDSVYSTGVVQEEDFDVLSAWNGLSQNVIIYGPNDTIPNGITPFVVTYIGENLNHVLESSGRTVLGIAYPNGEGTDLSATFKYATINLNVYSADLNSNDSYVKTVILHEMGHILKLGHPWMCAMESVSDRGTYDNEYMIFSIMNWGNPIASDTLAASTPTWHDMINLRNKFGG